MTAEELLHMLHERANAKQMQSAAQIIARCFAQRNVEGLVEIAGRIAQLIHRVDDESTQAAIFSCLFAQIKAYLAELNSCQYLESLAKQLLDRKFHTDILGVLAQGSCDEHEIRTQLCNTDPELAKINQALTARALQDLTELELVRSEPRDEDQGHVFYLTLLGQELHNHCYTD